MSLTFQLARGGIALAVVALLTATAWLAPASGSIHHHAWAAQSEVVTITCPLPPMRLASAPADLPKTRRLMANCRA